MDVKIITCHDVYNYGASLQAFALQSFIDSTNNKCEIIDYKPYYLTKRHKFWHINKRYNNLFLNILYFVYKTPDKFLFLIRKNNFKKFNSQYLKITEKSYINVNELTKCNCDILVCGSDQIWNTNFENGNDPAFFGDGIQKKYLISYAASIALDKIPTNKENWFKEKLKNFNAVSVRETSAQSELKRLDINSVVSLDPVYLLSKEQWINKLNLKEQPRDYLLIYMFDDTKEIKKENQKIIEYLAKKENLKIYNINSTKCPYAHKNFDNYGPEKFAELILNAKYIITNSFHGVSFSIIFRKNFWAVKRNGLNSRLYDMLKSIELENRFINKNNYLNIDIRKKIDFKKVNYILTKKITESKNYLITNIKNDK